NCRQASARGAGAETDRRRNRSAAREPGRRVSHSEGGWNIRLEAGVWGDLQGDILGWRGPDFGGNSAVQGLPGQYGDVVTKPNLNRYSSDEFDQDPGVRISRRVGLSTSAVRFNSSCSSRVCNT